ncbi:MAG: cytochrome C oxidase subunit II [Archangiaceae bacterium]|nr:cytochrome C oxidase subunit II [Archangiaceae bacterium]
MSISFPEQGWFKAPSAGERLWIGLAIAWCLVLTLAMPYWHFKGKQNSTGEAYRVTPAEFYQRAQKFIEAYKVGEDRYTAIVQPPPGTDVYLTARMWRWDPVLKLKKDQTYRVHVGSMDLNHGFSLQPVNMNFQVVPGYDHVLTLTPTRAGEYSIVCNEFCGVGHHTMAGKIIVEE